MVKDSSQPNQDHDAAADEAKYHLRNDKDLNKAYPLNEKILLPNHSPKESNMADTTSFDTDLNTVKNDLGKLRGDIAALKDSFQSFASERVRTGLSSAQETVDQWTEKARTRSRESLEDLADGIEERPLTSIFLAFGLGVILGRLFD